MSRQAVKFDFNKAEDAREFLKWLYVDGKLVTLVILANGETLEFKNMTDEQAMVYASQLYQHWTRGKEKTRLRWKPSFH